MRSRLTRLLPTLTRPQYRIQTNALQKRMSELAETKASSAAEANGATPEVKPEKKEAVSPDTKRPNSANPNRQSDRQNKSRNFGKPRNPVKFPRQGSSKFDPSSLGTTDDPDQIRKQVEFYFSDSNLVNDKFLLERVDGSKNEPVKIEVLHDFKRMKRFQPFSAVVAALKDSKTLDVLNDDTVRRKIPLDVSQGTSWEEAKKRWEDKTISRSIYAKGFGAEQAKTQFEIEAFFAPYGPTNAIRLRRFNNKNFKGSAFVEFSDDETQQKFMALDPKPKWQGRELTFKTKQDYINDKAAEIAARNVTPVKKEQIEGKEDTEVKATASAQKTEPDIKTEEKEIEQEEKEKPPQGIKRELEDDEEEGSRKKANAPSEGP